ncbi:MAG: hypothetical protein WCW84_10090 [Sulfurimonas sp.]|jgi:hypothetical protein
MKNETEELIEKYLPDHISIARNSKADDNDRYRFYNHATGEFETPGAKTVKELINKNKKSLAFFR